MHQHVTHLRQPHTYRDTDQQRVLQVLWVQQALCQAISMLRWHRNRASYTAEELFYHTLVELAAISGFKVVSGGDSGNGYVQNSFQDEPTK